MSKFLENHCESIGPHGGPDEVRLYPTRGGGNLILCFKCWAHKNRYNYDRGIETGCPENWPQHNWFEAKIYASNTEEEGQA